MTVTINGSTGITAPALSSDAGITADGISFADGTPANTLVTTTGGNVGIGTSSPSAKLDVRGIARVNEDNAGTKVIQLRSDWAGVGPAVQVATNDPLLFVSNGSERARIDSSGNLLVGTTSVLDGASGISVAASSTGGGVAGGLLVRNTASSGGDASPPLVVSKTMTTTSSSARFVQFYANNAATAMGGIVGNGASNVQFAALSDAREKTNIQNISGSLEKINTLRPVEFDWIADGTHINAGFIAQEVEAVFPEFVIENVADDGQEERKGLTGGMTGGIIPHLVKAIQEQQAIITQLQADVAALKGQA